MGAGVQSEWAAVPPQSVSLRGVCLGSGLILEDDDYYVPELAYELARSKSLKLSLIGSECLSETEIGYLLSKEPGGRAR